MTATERQGALANGPQVGLHPYKPRHGMQLCD